jgi:16S rRNA (guanine527-N7)-methyltransferase
VSGHAAPALVTALEDAQRLGFLGARPIPEVIAHARGFVRALAEHPQVGTVLDLGAGGGIPGLVIAHDRPDLAVTMLDRRAKRTDALERVVRRLGWSDRVSVVCQDVAGFEPIVLFDAIVARGFGPPEFTLETAARLVAPGGLVVISEPPGADRWDTSLLHRLGLRRADHPWSDDETSHPTPTGSRDPDANDASNVQGLVAVFVSE